MAEAGVFYDEIRIDVRDPDATHVYVYCRIVGDFTQRLTGWHYKSFPPTVPSVKILRDHMFKGGETDPLMWEMKTPNE